MVVTLSLGFLSFWCPGQWIMASSVGSQMASNSWKILCLFSIVFLCEVSKPAVYISHHEHDVWRKHINHLYIYSLFFSFSPSESLQLSNYFCPLDRCAPEQGLCSNGLLQACDHHWPHIPGCLNIAATVHVEIHISGGERNIYQVRSHTLDDVPHLQVVMDGSWGLLSGSRVAGLMAKDLSKVSLSIVKRRVWHWVGWHLTSMDWQHPSARFPEHVELLQVESIRAHSRKTVYWAPENGIREHILNQAPGFLAVGMSSSPHTLGDKKKQFLHS